MRDLIAQEIHQVSAGVSALKFLGILGAAKGVSVGATAAVAVGLPFAYMGFVFGASSHNESLRLSSFSYCALGLLCCAGVGGIVGGAIGGSVGLVSGAVIDTLVNTAL